MVELMLWSNKHSSGLVTSVKGKKVLDEIMKYGKDKYKELVNIYKIIEENRIKEIDTERNISTNKQKLFYNKSSNEKFLFSRNSVCFHK